jgi:alpha-N-arabinofuranosidase
MDGFIKSVAAICDAVKAKKHAKKTINLSFDELNVWYHSNGDQIEDWQVAPHINEDIYNFEDALLVGCMLMTLQNNCDRVKIACLAQLVNVIAPIMTENDGKAWAQTIFYPYMYASQYGRGKVLQGITQCDTYQTSDKLDVPYVETSVVWNEEKREITLFAVNRSLEEDLQLSLELGGFETAQMVEHVQLYSDDLKTINTKDAQNVQPIQKEIQAKISADQQVILDKQSWNMIRFTY